VWVTGKSITVDYRLVNHCNPQLLRITGKPTSHVLSQLVGDHGAQFVDVQAKLTQLVELMLHGSNAVSITLTLTAWAGRQCTAMRRWPLNTHMNYKT